MTHEALPLYARLKASLLADIVAGTLRPQDQLPSHSQLCAQHRVSYMTMRRAIRELVIEGVLHAVPGKGGYVAEAREVAESDPLRSFSEEMALRGKRASSRVLDAALCDAEPLRARLLGVPPGSTLVRLLRLRLADGAPVAIHSTYLRHDRCPGLLEHDLATTSLYHLLRTVYGLELVAARSSVGAALATDEQAALLEVATPCALLVTEQLTFLATGEPVARTHACYRGYRYRMELP